MLRLLRPRRAAVVGVLGLALLGAACSSNDAGTSGSQTPAPSTTAASMTASGPFRGRLRGRAGQRRRQPGGPGSGPGGHRRLQHSGPVDPGHRGEEGRPGRHPERRPGHHRVRAYNDAFSALPKATLDKALGDPDELLTTVLTYHVVEGQLSLTNSPAATRPSRAARSRSAAAARTSRSTAPPAWSAATSRPPTPASTSMTRCSFPRADHPPPGQRGHRHHHAGGVLLIHFPLSVASCDNAWSSSQGSRMSSQVQVLAGPPPAIISGNSGTGSFGPVRQAVYRMTPHDWLLREVSWTSFSTPCPLLCHHYQRRGDEAAPGADAGKRGLGLPLSSGAGTGPRWRGQPPGAATPGVSSAPVYNPGTATALAWRCEDAHAVDCRP